MEHRVLGKTGMRVSVLGFGGAEIGFHGISDAEVSKLLNSALDAGLNVIDTAECYVTSEELIGRTVAHRRKDFFLFTKCGHAHGYEHHDWNDPAKLQEGFDRSLRNLKTDCVDVLQIHSCTAEDLCRGVVVEFVQRMQKAGKTRFIGYSGDSKDALAAIELGLFATLQTSVSIADQEAITLTLPKAAERKMGVIAKRPLANVMWKQQAKPDEYYLAYWGRLKKLDYDFIRQSPDGAVGTALRFTLSQPGVATAIVGTTRPGRWQENARLASAGPLPNSEQEAIRRRWSAVAGPDWTGQI